MLWLVPANSLLRLETESESPEMWFESWVSSHSTWPFSKLEHYDDVFLIFSLLYKQCFELKTWSGSETGCFRIRLDAYYYTHECITKTVSVIKMQHTYRAQGRQKTHKFDRVSYFITHFNKKKPFMNWFKLPFKTLQGCGHVPISHGHSPVGFK